MTQKYSNFILKMLMLTFPICQLINGNEKKYVKEFYKL